MTEPVLAVKGVHKSFGALRASDGISLELQPGEIHALIGPNGAGKTTLIAQISGTLRPDAGQIEFLGRDVTRLGAARRARAGLARTFQISALALEDTVLQNALLGVVGARGRAFVMWRAALEDAPMRAQAMAALERVGLARSAGRLTGALSHGERRQLEVAVALTQSPKALIMDEPMAGLGGEGSRKLTSFLGALRAEMPILLVEHDMDAVFALADRITVLDYGRVIASGATDDIRQDPRVQAAYLGDEGLA